MLCRRGDRHLLRQGWLAYVRQNHKAVIPRDCLTDEQYEAVGRRSRVRSFPLDLEKAHARHDRAHEVDVEYGQDIYEMENHSDG